MTYKHVPKCASCGIEVKPFKTNDPDFPPYVLACSDACMDEIHEDIPRTWAPVVSSPVDDDEEE